MITYSSQTLPLESLPPHAYGPPPYLPVVVKVMMAAACCWNEASTAAMAVVWTVVVGLGVSRRSSSNTLRWNIAASASRAILPMIVTASTGYFPEGGREGGSEVEKEGGREGGKQSGRERGKERERDS